MENKNSAVTNNFTSSKDALEMIQDVSFDYDGCKTIESLKHLIDEIREYANAGLKTPKWIKIEDELPETTEFVWVCSGDIIMDAYYNKEYGWSASNVTHWMPIITNRPEPPEE